MTEENIEINIEPSPNVVGYSINCETGISTPILDSEEYQTNLLALQTEAEAMRAQEQQKEDAKLALAQASGLSIEQINLLF